MQMFVNVLIDLVSMSVSEAQDGGLRAFGPRGGALGRVLAAHCGDPVPWAVDITYDRLRCALVNAAGERRDWQRAEELWSRSLKASKRSFKARLQVEPTSACWAALAKAQLLAGRATEAAKAAKRPDEEMSHLGRSVGSSPSSRGSKLIELEVQSCMLAA